MPEHDLVKSYGIPGTMLHLSTASSTYLPRSGGWVPASLLTLPGLGMIPLLGRLQNTHHGDWPPVDQCALHGGMQKPACRCSPGTREANIASVTIWLEFKPNKRFFSVQDLNPSTWCHHLDRNQEVLLCEEWDYRKDSALWLLWGRPSLQSSTSGACV